MKRKKLRVRCFSFFQPSSEGLTWLFDCRCKGGHVPGMHFTPFDDFPVQRRSIAAIFQQIQLRAEDLYDKDKVDLETIVVDDVFKLLQCTDAGLDQAEATRRIELFGPNRLESEEQNAFLQVRSHAARVNLTSS